MAILSRSAGGAQAPTAARRHLPLAVALTTLAGCVIVNALSPRDRGLAFSHRVHVEDEGMDCSDCHLDVESSDEPGMPPRAICALCHADEDEAEKPPERRIATLFEGETFKAARAAALPGEVIFSHLLHAGDGQDCANCHRGISENERIDAGIGVSMDRCSACHQALGTPNECATCHTTLREDVSPGNHDGNWKRIHGAICRAETDSMVGRCSLCHTESSCTSCHRDERPASHTAYWDRRGHGVQARMDLQRCITCHQTDSCDQCHREVEPSSHYAGWGSPKNNHCLGCHFGFGNQGCATCHEDTSSHALATPKPPDHTPGMNCLQCHGVTQPLPHANKGDDCNLCHM